MLTSTLIGLLIGAVLARSKVLVLFPVIFLTSLIAIGAAVARPDAVLSTAATAATIIVSLQIGYLLGTVVRRVIQRAREIWLRPNSLIG